MTDRLIWAAVAVPAALVGAAVLACLVGLLLTWMLVDR